MDPYLVEMHNRSLCGIRVKQWLTFFKAFQENADEERIKRELDRLAAQVTAENKEKTDTGEALEMILSGLRKLLLPRDSS